MQKQPQFATPEMEKIDVSLLILEAMAANPDSSFEDVLVNDFRSLLDSPCEAAFAYAKSKLLQLDVINDDHINDLGKLAVRFGTTLEMGTAMALGGRMPSHIVSDCSSDVTRR